MKLNSTGTRAWLYSGLAGLIFVGGWVEKAPDHLTWKDWLTVIVGTAVAAGWALRAFIDGSAERDRQANANGFPKPPPAAVPGQINGGLKN